MHRTGFKHDAAQNRNATHTCVQICHCFWVGRGGGRVVFCGGFFDGERSLCSLRMLPGSLFGLSLDQFATQPLRLWARQRRSRALCQSLAALHTSDRCLVAAHRRKHQKAETLPSKCFVFLFYLFIYFSFVFRREHDSVAVVKVVFHQGLPNGANLCSPDKRSCPRRHQKNPIEGTRKSRRRDRVPCRAAKGGTTLPAVNWLGTRNSPPLMRRCGGRHKPFIKPSRRVCLRLDGCCPPTHPLGDVFIFSFLFFSPYSRTMEFCLRKCQTRAGRCVSPPVCPVHGCI